MTVKELIDKLNSYPDEMPVMVSEFHGGSDEEILGPVNGLEVVDDEYLRIYCHDDF